MFDRQLFVAVVCLLVAWPRPMNADESDRVKIALVAMHSEMGQPDENLKRVGRFADQARQAGAKFVVFTEECLTGSLNKSKLTRQEVTQIVARGEEIALPRLEEIAKKNQQTLIVGTTIRDGEKYRNAALIVGPAGRLAAYYKLWLPNENEGEFFIPGTELPVIDSQRWRFSVGICADLDRGEYFDAASRAGAELFLLPIAGSGYGELVGANGDQAKQAAKHRELHEPIMREWGRRHALYVGYANQAGLSGDNWFPGLSIAVDPLGEPAGVHAATEGLLVVEAHKDVLTRARAGLERPATPPKLTNSAGEQVKIRFVGK